MATVTIVPTPIGNLQDITIRAILCLFECDYLLTEDVKKSVNLLNHLRTTYPTFLKSDKTPKVIKFNEYTENSQLDKYIKLLEENCSIALTSSAGTPLFSDPGYKFVQYALEMGINITVLPGPTAAIPALVASGMPTDQVLFLGFLPRKDGKRSKVLENVSSKIDSLFHPTIIIYESPHRLAETLKMIKEHFGNVQMALCRELTKIHEEILLLPIEEAIEKYQTSKPKGEFVLLYKV